MSILSLSLCTEVQHWDDMELIWRHVYSEMKACYHCATERGSVSCSIGSPVKVNAEEHPVLLTEACTLVS